MFFDTGAASLTLDLGHLPASWRSRLEDGPEAGLSALTPSALRSVLLGGFPLGREVPVWATPAGSITAGRPFAGGAGAAVVRNFIVVLDYGDPAIRLETPQSTPPQGFLPVPVSYHPDSGFPRVTVEIGDTAYPMLFDSGARVSMISEAVADEWRRVRPDWPQVRGSAGHADMGTRDPERMVRLPSLKLGPLTVRRPLFVTRSAGRFEQGMSRFMSGPIVGAVADSVLRHANWWMDFPGSRLYTVPIPDAPFDPGIGIGIRVTWESGGWRVTEVLPSHHPATTRALVPGDLLIAVEGQALAAVHHHELTEMLGVREGASVRFTILREGREQVTEGRGARYI
ncbi:MAG: aspartyl protease family protein [Clostridia bacterium]